jgi:hypothetical protein
MNYLSLLCRRCLKSLPTKRPPPQPLEQREQAPTPIDFVGVDDEVQLTRRPRQLKRDRTPSVTKSSSPAPAVIAVDVVAPPVAVGEKQRASKRRKVAKPKPMGPARKVLPLLS